MSVCRVLLHCPPALLSTWQGEQSLLYSRFLDRCSAFSRGRYPSSGVQLLPPLRTRLVRLLTATTEFLLKTNIRKKNHTQGRRKCIIKVIKMKHFSYILVPRITGIIEEALKIHKELELMKLVQIISHGGELSIHFLHRLRRCI